MIFLLWLFFSFIVALIGSGKTTGFFLSFFLSLLLSPIIGLIIVAMAEGKEAKRLREEVEKLNRGKYKTDEEILLEYRGKKE